MAEASSDIDGATSGLAVSTRGVTKAYDNGVMALGPLDLDVRKGEFVALLGPSGCGKSTLLNAIAGLIDVRGGEIHIGGRDVTFAEPKDRGIAMVFQSYALYPRMTVRKNMSFGLQVAGTPQDEIGRRLAEAAQMLRLTDLLDRRPSELSGGQRQRVAMGRAIVRQPKVFLFDEPLSNLDAKLRVQMRTEIKRVHQLVKTTTVYVTHDQVEAMTLADRVVVMNAGRIDQIGTPQEVYHHPKTRFVAGFIGSPTMNFLPCRLVENGAGLTVRLADWLSFPVPPAREAHYRQYAGSELLFGLRPEHITESRSDAPAGVVPFSARLDVVEPMGMETMVYFIVDGIEVCGRVDPAAPGNVGEMMPLVADLNQMHLIDPRTEQVI
jgi:multiple sugar transport system ATP-binding protein